MLPPEHTAVQVPVGKSEFWTQLNPALQPVRQEVLGLPPSVPLLDPEQAATRNTKTLDERRLRGAAFLIAFGTLLFAGD